MEPVRIEEFNKENMVPLTYRMKPDRTMWTQYGVKSNLEWMQCEVERIMDGTNRVAQIVSSEGDYVTLWVDRVA